MTKRRATGSQPVLTPPTSLRGRDVLYRADDGKDYFGCVTKVLRGVATIVYETDGGTKVTATVTDATRLFSAD